MSILGNRVLRREDPALLRGEASYVANLPLPGAAWLAYVRSPVAHGRVLELDCSRAARMPGVVDVLAGADVDMGRLTSQTPGAPEATYQPWLAVGTVRFVGEPVVAVVAETAAQAADAAEAVVVEYETLPVVTGADEAVGGETLLFPEVGTNVVLDLDFGHQESLLDGCEVVLRHRFVNQRLAPCPLEVRAAASSWDEDGKLTHWASSQAPHAALRRLMTAFDLERGQVRVVTADVGGGFGAKIGSYPEELLVPWVARRLGRPVRWVETRSESMVGLGHGRAQVQDVTIGGTADGRILAYRLDVLQDAGAYPAMGGSLTTLTRMMASGVYRIPRVEFRGRSVVTNTTPTVAYRGAGRPEATAAIERAVDLFAGRVGLDPAEVRRRNLVPADAFPYRSPTGVTYDVGDYPAALELVLRSAGYDGLRAEQARRRADGARVQLGIGISTYVEVTNGFVTGELGAVSVAEDGRVTVLCGTCPQGQGHATAFSMLAADVMGVPMDRIDVRFGDTDVVPRGVGTFGSRSLQTGGVAVRRAATEVVEQARQVAADLLEAAPEDVVLDVATGAFHVAGAPGVSRSWAELAVAAGKGEAPGGGLSAEIDFRPEGATFPYGAHVAVVAVDVETGHAALARLVAVDDAGRILNPLLAEGQLHGGLAQGVAQALLEEVRYDEAGNPLTTNLADYAFVSAAELPSFELVHMETPTPLNELGAKGIGESGTIGAAPAVQNAVVDALAHLGVSHLDMPATPERVWRAIAATGSRA
ncbi:MAG: xanthine dehydrogenase family protein molybdopterin-binding subunit [Acidimicrobiales bacterium]